MASLWDLRLGCSMLCAGSRHMVHAIYAVTDERAIAHHHHWGKHENLRPSMAPRFLIDAEQWREEAGRELLRARRRDTLLLFPRGMRVVAFTCPVYCVSAAPILLVFETLYKS